MISEDYLLFRKARIRVNHSLRFFKPVRSALSAAVVLILLNKSFSQMPNTFVIADSGSQPSIASDFNGGVYVTWTKRNDAVFLKHIDSLGNPIEDSVRFANTSACIQPRVVVNRKYVLVVWDNRISNYINFNNSYIDGCIIGRDSMRIIQYLTFNNSYRDAYRFNPDAQFLDDTTLVVVWAGNGPSTPSPQIGIYGQFASVIGGKIGDNFPVTDNVGSTIDNWMPRTVYDTTNNRFIVTWIDGSSGVAQLYGKKFDFTGAPLGTSFLISDDSTISYLFFYSVAKDSSGNFVVAWNAQKGNKGQVEWRWFDADGVPLSNVEELTPLDTLIDAGNTIDVSIDENGRIVLVTEQKVIRGIYKVCGMRYLADRSAYGNSFGIPSTDQSHTQFNVNVMLRKGKILAVCEQEALDYMNSSVIGSVQDFDNVSSVIEKEHRNNGSVETCSLYPCYPNPFNPTTTIAFRLSASSEMRLGVYDLLGREVVMLLTQYLNAGEYFVKWNGSDKYGSLLASGMYFVRMTAGSDFHTQKIVLLR